MYTYKFDERNENALENKKIRDADSAQESSAMCPHRTDNSSSGSN
jgi:hypothetical protein